MEYLGDSPEKPKSDGEHQENIQYSEVMDFAFFAVHFGYSKSDYHSLTPTEKQFILKAYEDKVVSDSNIVAAAVANAVGNVMRKKGKRPQKLWRKKPGKGDEKERADAIRIATTVEEKEGKGWITAIYQANGMRLKMKEGDGK